ncbi:MAG: peptidylprolyl isomerase [Bacilli bacterium]|nr:peptidylprolyl isomerase [Bacilli bacterium]
MKKIFLLILVMLLVVTGCGSKKEEKKENKPVYLYGLHYVEIDVDGYGKIELELNADEAPITVTNFIKLVNDGFYDGLTFHRIMDGFVAQGGGYDIDGNKRLTDSIKGEFSANGIANGISHTRGTISMARRNNDYNSASSEFFIMHKDATYLDGGYAAFGHVTKGMDVVDKIVKKAKPTDNNGSIELDKRPVIKSIKVIEK